jgi:DNA-binding response OmpR family regulator
MPSPHRILIIDDNEEILVSLKSFLSKKDYYVVTASNGLDGLKLYEAASGDFDLVITDLVMPNISGVALISIFKKRSSHPPIIAITGYGEQPESLAREAQADVVLEKPFKLDELEEIIREILEKGKAPGE